MRLSHSKIVKRKLVHQNKMKIQVKFLLKKNKVPDCISKIIRFPFYEAIQEEESNDFIEKNYSEQHKILDRKG